MYSVYLKATCHNSKQTKQNQHIQSALQQMKREQHYLSVQFLFENYCYPRPDACQIVTFMIYLYFPHSELFLRFLCSLYYGQIGPINSSLKDQQYFSMYQSDVSF